MRRNSVIALSLLAFPPFAAPQEWVSYANSPQGDQGFVDRASLKIDGSTRR